MKKYPKLTDMGVLHPLQIDSFSVNSIDYTDVLRLTYVRPKGSFLPLTKTFKFPRIQKNATVDKDGTNTQIVMETDPRLREVLDELREITETKEHNRGIAAAILDELRALEEDVALRRSCIEELLTHIHDQK